MAQTPAQLLAAAKKQIAKTQASIAAATPTTPRVNTSTIAGITAASKAAPVIIPTVDDTWATKVLASGKTQAQIDALRGAYDTAAMLRDNYGNVGINSYVDPKTGKVITTNTGPKNPTDDGSNDTTSKDITKKEISDATRDAFAMLKDLFTSYGLEDLAGEIEGYMTSGLTATEALIKLKTNPSGSYATRFSGNFARQKSGLNMLSEAAYIDLENSYAQTLKSYGLGDMLSVDKKANWKTFADYIANDISAVEFKERIDTVENRVINADPTTKALFKEWYPSLTDKDLVAYFLDPTRTIDKLKAKTAAAEIGAAFKGQGLSTDVTSAEGFATYGIDRAGALQGAADIKGVLPRSQDLSKIYQEAGIDYTQKTGEEEFLKTNADAAEKRRRLKSMERASFMGDSGVSSQVGSLTKNTQGAF